MAEFLVLDMKHGGMDGWYKEREDAERVAIAIKEKLGHNDVIVVESEKGIHISDYCWLPTREENGGFYGPIQRVNADPPEEHWKRCAISRCTEILADLYSDDYSGLGISERVRRLLSIIDNQFETED